MKFESYIILKNAYEHKHIIMLHVQTNIAKLLLLSWKSILYGGVKVKIMGTS